MRISEQTEGSMPSLTDEFKVLWEEVRSLHEAGIPAGDPTAKCLPPGMPRLMGMDVPMEIIITPSVTYIYVEWDSQLRRIFTDGREFPEYIPPSFNGYSIGEWEDLDEDGVYDLLTVETRGFSGPRSFDERGMPLHDNGETIVHESLRFIDEHTLENRMTTIDDALTEPWTSVHRYSRRIDDIVWRGHLCVNSPRHFQLGEYWYIYHPNMEFPEPANADQPPLVFEPHEF